MSREIKSSQNAINAIDTKANISLIDKVSQENFVEYNYLSNKSILYIGSFENNKYNIEAFQKKFKLFESSLSSEYILNNIKKYDIIFYIDDEDIEILRKIRMVDTQIPIVVYTNEDTLQTMKYLNYNISHFISTTISTLEIILIIQYELKNSEVTKKYIHSQKEQLEYLKILDDFIIISRTDLKGNITYVNDIFCEISGYSEDELLGSPHNIVRHPEMPKDAFKGLWNTIKNDEIWSGTVKNKAKNGETYIAKSSIIPYYENEVKVGYLGLRYVITDEVTEKKAIKAYLAKSVVDFKTQLRNKNDEIEKYLEEIELLKRTNSNDYYIGWQRELKKNEKTKEQINAHEEKIKETESLYTRRIDKFLTEKREYDKMLTKKNDQINTLNDEVATLNELLNESKINIQEKLSTINQLQKRNAELEDIIEHK